MSSREHSSKVGDHVTNIIAGCLEDMNIVSVEMLDTLLRRLIPEDEDVRSVCAADTIARERLRNAVVCAPVAGWRGR